jgi:hypothetical protein
MTEIGGEEAGASSAWSVWPQRARSANAVAGSGKRPGSGARLRGFRRTRFDGRLPGLRLPPRTPDLPLPEGAELRELTHTCAAGAWRYRLYVPASAGEGLQGLVVMLHGLEGGRNSEQA